MNNKILAFIFDGNKFLALRNNSKDPSHGGDFWFTVTGSIEKNETEIEAVKREVKEETNLDIKNIFDLNGGSIYSWNNKNYQEKNFIVFVKKGNVKLNEEHVEYKWVRLKKFVSLINWEGNKDELKKILKLGIRKVSLFQFTRFDDYTSKILRTIFIDRKNKITLSWCESDDFSKMKDVKQCYGICFYKNKILIINNGKNKWKWNLPGGTPEKNETFEQTLIREVDEEADIEIDNIIPIGYNKIEETKNGKTNIFYQLRYIARIAKIKRQTIDPATNIIHKRKFIKPEEFISYSLWGKPGEAMIKRAIEKHGNTNFRNC